MKRHLILLFVGVSLPFLLAAQQKNSVSITKRVLRIPEVTVVGKRPMKDIGVQRTRFDSIAMKENIALSMFPFGEYAAEYVVAHVVDGSP